MSTESQASDGPEGVGMRKEERCMPLGRVHRDDASRHMEDQPYEIKRASILGFTHLRFTALTPSKLVLSSISPAKRR